MNKSDTYLAFGEWEDICAELTLEEKGQMWDALFAYWRRGEKPTFSDRTVKTAWIPIQSSSDRNAEAYKDKCEKNRENGKKGGRPKKDSKEKTEKPNGYFGFSEKTEKTLPDPYPDPDPNRYINKPKKTKFHNFDERTYTDEQYEALMEGGKK